MKRILVLAVLPIILFALEKVNLIKDHSFENNIEMWYTHAGGDGDMDSAIANSHDSEKAFTGNYCGSSDTRIKAGSASAGYDDSALVMQGFVSDKTVADIDSLTLSYSISPCQDMFSLVMTAFVALYLDAGQSTYLSAGYYFKPSDFTPGSIPHRAFLESFDITSDTLWHNLEQNIKTDIVQRGISTTSKVDSLFVMGWGVYYPPWRGQKIYWDDIRLTGYADYDVGVKGILSRDSIGNAYVPTARIKNFGRKPADSFLVIATIEGGSGTVYADTLTWSLTADTEDTLSFKGFEPSDASNYTLTVSTFMTPDESDEDDMMSKTLYGTGIEEQPTPQDLNLDVLSLQAGEGVLRVSYSLPLGEQGSISLYDPSGRRIESHTVIGSGRVTMNSALPSGIYFIKLETSRTTITRKTVLLR